MVVIVAGVLDPETLPGAAAHPASPGVLSAKLEKHEAELTHPDHNLNPAHKLGVHVRVVRPNKSSPPKGSEPGKRPQGR